MRNEDGLSGLGCRFVVIETRSRQSVYQPISDSVGAPGIEHTFTNTGSTKGCSAGAHQ